MNPIVIKQTATDKHFTLGHETAASDGQGTEFDSRLYVTIHRNGRKNTIIVKNAINGAPSVSIDQDLISDFIKILATEDLVSKKQVFEGLKGIVLKPIVTKAVKQ